MVRLRFQPIASSTIDEVWEEQTFERAREAARYPMPPKPAGRYLSEESASTSDMRLIVEAVQTLERKVDYAIAILDRMSETEMKERFGEPVPCDISGAGMRFASDTAPKPDDVLLVVFVPGGHTGRPVHTVARVVRVDGHDPVWGTKPHRVAIDFERIAEEDRERIISRTFDLQREVLRARRTERSAPDAD